MVFYPWIGVWFCCCCEVVGLVGVVASIGEVYGPVIGAAVVTEVAVGLCDVCDGAY